MMKREPGKTPAVLQEMKKMLLACRQMLQKAGRCVLHRGWWKLLSLALAVLLWGGLISQNTALPRPKVIENVRVNVSNAAVLRQNGLIVVSGLEDLDAVNLKVDVPQKYYSSASAGNYTVRLDLSQIKEPGEQVVRITAAASNSTIYGTVTEISVPQITVQVEEYVVRSRVPVQLIVEGEAPAGFYAASPSCDPARVDISGPKSIVDQVVRCVAQYDMGQLLPVAGTARTGVSFAFQDKNGNELDASLLTVTSQSIALSELVVEQAVYPAVDLKVSTKNLFSGEPAPGYEVVGVTVYPDTVKIAASDLTAYQGENAAIFPEGRLNINGETRGVTGVLPLRTKVGIVYSSVSAVTVVVDIAPVQTEKTEQAE